MSKILSIMCKVSDRFAGTLIDENGKTLLEVEESYVPSFMPGDGYGDYIELDINLDTGQILNWKKPSDKDLQDWIEKNS